MGWADGPFQRRDSSVCPLVTHHHTYTHIQTSPALKAIVAEELSKREAAGEGSEGTSAMYMDMSVGMCCLLVLDALHGRVLGRPCTDPPSINHSIGIIAQHNNNNTRAAQGPRAEARHGGHGATGRVRREEQR